jgi:hypothetical protein
MLWSLSTRFLTNANKIIHNQKKVQVLTMSIHQNKPIATANFEDECAFGNAMKDVNC